MIALYTGCIFAGLPVSVSIFGLDGMLGFLVLHCGSSSPDVALQDHLEQREVDVDQALCQVAPSCTAPKPQLKPMGPVYVIQKKPDCELTTLSHDNQILFTAVVSTGS